MDIYTDYANWKLENYDTISTLGKLKSKIISRISHVFLVVDFLYDKCVNEGGLDSDLDTIFETGFNYIHDHFLTILSILQSEYRGNIVEMDKNSKTINLLLYVHDFENEYYNVDNFKQEHYNKLSNLEDTVYEYVENHKEVPDGLFGLLSEITLDIFDDYQGVNEIFYEIALDLNLINQEDNFEEYDPIFGNYE